MSTTRTAVDCTRRRRPLSLMPQHLILAHMALHPEPRFFLLKAKLIPASPIVRNLICTKVDAESDPSEKSILIHNVPPLISEKHVSNAITRIAPVHSVSFHSDQQKVFGQAPQIAYNKALVTFKDASGRKLVAESPADTVLVLSVPMSETRIVSLLESRQQEATNMQKNRDKWKKEADDIVRLYDEEMRVKEKVTKLCSGEVDDEGWHVVRRNRPDSLNREKAMLQKIKLKQEKKKQMEDSVADMYQYRMRNEKLGKLRLLRQKFEEDKNRVAQMRAGRKFKPM